MSTLMALTIAMSTLGGAPDGVVLNFTSTHCPPCQQMRPIVERLQQQGYAIRKVDVQHESVLAERFNVTAVPTFVLVVAGRERERVSGPLSESELRRLAGSIPEKLADSPAPNVNTVAGARSPTVAKAQSELFPGRSKPLEEVASPVIRANVSASNGPTIASDPMQSAARIRVTDSKGLDFGSGTIIASEPGRTLILTCGHLFRHFDQQSRIDVDVFDRESFQRYEGTLLKHNIQKDIGLISIKTVSPLPVSLVASQLLSDGEQVHSVGSGGGQPPTKLLHQVTKTKGYQEDLLECTGVPVQGRSGGGLFNAKGEVAGVCVLADRNGRRGLYTGLKTIHWLLDQCGLTAIYQRPARAAAEMPSQPAQERSVPVFSDEPIAFKDSSKSQALELSASDDEAFPAENQPSFGNESPFADRGRLLPNDTSTQPAATTAAAATPSVRPQFEPEAPLVVSPSASTLKDTLDAARGAEVVCIIRDPARPETGSRVVIIHRASERFVADLTNEVDQQVQPTSLPVKLPTRATAVGTTAGTTSGVSTPRAANIERYRRSRSGSRD